MEVCHCAECMMNVLSQLDQATHELEEMDALRARLAELERDREMAFRLMRARETRLDAIRDALKQNKGDDLVRAEVEWLLDCDYAAIDAAMGRK